MHKDKEAARQKRGAMNFMRRPHIIGHQQEQENIRSQVSHRRLSVNGFEWQTGNRCRQKRNRSDHDNALVRLRIEARPESKQNKSGKDHHVCHRNNVKSQRIPARREPTSECIRGS